MQTNDYLLHTHTHTHTHTGAAERWETNEGPSYRDDISCFVVYFAEPGSGAGAGTTTIARAD